MSRSLLWYSILIFFVTLLLQCNDSKMYTECLATKGSDQRWVIRNPPKSNLPSGLVISGNTTYISVNQSFSQFSHDGKSWENINLSTGTLTHDYRVSGGIVFGNNEFVAITWPNIFTSADGSSWKIKSDSSKYFGSIAFGNNTFIIVGSDGFVLTSSNGETWERHDVDTAISFGSITFGNNQFVATCESPEQIMTSRDGITWSDPFRIDEHGIVISAIFGNGLFLIAGPQNYMSSDGRTWSLMEDGIGEQVFFLNNQFVSFELGNPSGLPVQKFIISQDLKSMSEIKADLLLKDPLLTYINGQYVAFDRQTGFACSSKDLSHWTVPNTITSKSLRDVAFGNGIFIVVGDSGTTLWSPTCSTWTLTSAKTPKNLNAIVFKHSRFVAVGDAGTIVSSKDGKSWTKVSSGTTSDLNSICFENNLLVAVSDAHSGPILSSKDGVTWTHSKTTASDNQRLIYGNGKFVIVGHNTILVSSDGKEWEKATVGNGEFKECFFDGTFFKVTGYDYDARENICLISEDGKWWKRSKLIITNQKETVPYGIGKCEIIDHKLFWRASDSLLFEISSQSFHPASVCYGNGCFVGVGDLGRIATLIARYEPYKQQKQSSVPPKKIEAFSRKMFVCEMEHQYVFLMTLTSNGKNVTGEYRYLRQSKSLRLEGHVDADGVIRLNEHVDNGECTGSFVAKISGSEFIGEWRTPDSSRRLYFDGHETSENEVAAQLEAFRNAYGKWVGIYEVTSISGSAGANTMYDCNLGNGEWACSGSSISQGYREPFDEYEPDFSLSVVGTIKLEIKPDLTIELTVNKQKRMNLPAVENKLAYFGGSTTIAKNIKIRELDPSGNNGTYVFTCSKDTLSFSLEGNPTLTFTKIQN